MKFLKNIFIVSVAMITVASCKIDEPLSFEVEKPETIREVEYLNVYDVLSSYIDRSANPNFKLGAITSGTGTAATNFANGQIFTRVLASNFDQILINNVLRHNDVVQDDGSMDFSNVATALDAAEQFGLSIFGHTLLWHTNQRGAFLKDRMFKPGEDKFTEKLTNGNFETDDLTTSFQFTANANPVIIDDAIDGRKAMKIESSDRLANDYSMQFWIKIDPFAKAEEIYTLKLTIRSEKSCNIALQAHAAPQDYNSGLFSISSTEGWTTFEREITVSASNAPAAKGGMGSIAFNIGQIETTVYISRVSLVKKELSEVEVLGPEQLPEGNFITDDLTASIRAQGSNLEKEFVPYGDGRALKLTIPERKAASYTNQLFMVHPVMGANDRYELSLDVKVEFDDADQVDGVKRTSVNIGGQIHSSPGSYVAGSQWGSVQAKTEWSTFTARFTPGNRDNIGACVLDIGQLQQNVDGMRELPVTLYFANISLRKVTLQVENILTEDEQIANINDELERWIENVMDIAGEYVKEWIVVNDPISTSAPYELRTAPENAPAADFYWQDVLGKDYAVKGIQFARQYGASDIKLFINDGGLETEGKLQGLIDYVEYVDGRLNALGQQPVEGIGTKMNNLTSNTSKEDIENMFKALAATGKLIKITELSIGLGSGVTAPTDRADAIYKEQAEMYQFVVEKYIQHIPEAQRAGITVGTPVSTATGLWNDGYLRKPAYGGFANGLAGRDVSADQK